ncbi:tyrosine-type recombinase/integrase [Pseudalkalibacillus sp. R45]|uniref:tyrosine-type recombinase/integrase n=1 Tax=Pseudalkalibacillus sp. R45 TaxID=3457433 RepID=UPI003FCD0CC0
MSNQETPQTAIDFVLDLEKRGRQASTVKRYKYDLEDYLAWIRVNELSYNDSKIFTPLFVQSYFDFLINERSYSYRTLKRVYSVLNQFHRFLISKKIIGENPVSSIELHNDGEERFTDDMFITEVEQGRIVEIIPSEQGLTENQLKAHNLLSKRNLSILTLMIKHGMTLHEVSAIDTRHISFIQKELLIPNTEQTAKRKIKFDQEENEILFDYFQSIPESVRPGQFSSDPFFVAFDFQRLTYRWSYEEDRPKRLTEIAIQKMIRQEIQRAGLRKGISAQHFRRTAILKAILNGDDTEQIQNHFGMKTPLTLNRYLDYVEHLSQPTSLK